MLQSIKPNTAIFSHHLANKVTLSLAASVLLSLLTACGGSSNHTPDPVVVVPPITPPPAVEIQYQLTVSNLTNGQPFAPIAVLLHQSGDYWQIGQPASDMLERLAESGDTSGLIGADLTVSSTTNGAILLPGASTEMTITTTDATAIKLSLAAMLVNSNDGFAGLNSIDLAALAVGDSWMMNGPVYDAGTEANSEQPGTMPGPADGGEGFNAARDDVNYVAMHPGIVSGDDGLTASVLSGEHKFDNPAMSVKIQRIQ